MSEVSGGHASAVTRRCRAAIRRTGNHSRSSGSCQMMSAARAHLVTHAGSESDSLEGAFPVVGRLKPGVTLEAAQAEMSVFRRDIARDYPDSHKGWSIMSSRCARRHGARVAADIALPVWRRRLRAAPVLRQCCQPAAGSQQRRSRELAVRSAFGAGRSRIVAQLLTESLVLASSVGCGTGVGMAILKVSLD